MPGKVIVSKGRTTSPARYGQPTRTASLERALRSRSISARFRRSVVFIECGGIRSSRIWSNGQLQKTYEPANSKNSKELAGHSARDAHCGDDFYSALGNSHAGK